MTVTEIEVKLPVQDATKSIEYATFTADAIAAEMKINDAFKNKNNTLVIVATCTTAGTITLIGGDNYPNAMLGNFLVAVAVGTNVIKIEDISRFENRDGSVLLTSETAVGTIFATAKRAGITPGELQ